MILIDCTLYLVCSQSRPRGYKTFFMLTSAEHEIYPALKCKMPTIAMQQIFSVQKYRKIAEIFFSKRKGRKRREIIHGVTHCLQVFILFTFKSL